jgi:hypothetical protein
MSPPKDEGYPLPGTLHGPQAVLILCSPADIEALGLSRWGAPGINHEVTETRITRDDVESALAARQELGPEMEPAVIDAFLDKVDRAVEARAAAETAQKRHVDDRDGMSLALAIVSLGTGIPITAIAADAGGVQGIIVAWAGIVGVNFAQRFKRS